MCFSRPYTLSKGVRRCSSSASRATASTLANLVLMSVMICRMVRRVNPWGWAEGGSQGWSHAVDDTTLKNSLGLVPDLVAVVGILGDGNGSGVHTTNDWDVGRGGWAGGHCDRSVGRRGPTGKVISPFLVVQNVGDEATW